MFAVLKEDALAEAAALFCDIYANPPWSFSWINEENVRRFFVDSFNAPGFRGYISTTGGRVNAVCVGHIDDYFSASTYELREIVVSRNYQRRGLGRRFLAYIEKALASEGVRAITLVTRENIGAYPFYIDSGYVKSDLSVHMNKAIT